MMKQLVYESEILQRDLECTETKLDENKRKTEVIKRDYNSIKDDVMQGKDHYGTELFFLVEMLEIILFVTLRLTSSSLAFSQDLRQG
jgi:hypothetical protein